MTSSPRPAFGVSRRSRLVGGVLGAALAAGLIAPAAAGAAAAPAARVTPHTARTAHTAHSAHSAKAPHGGTQPHAARPVVKATAVRRVLQSTAEARLLQLVNSQRTAHHLVPLVEAAGPTDVARRWSAQLAGAGALSHNPALVAQVQGAGGGNWHWLAENVGVAPAGATDALFAAYMASTHHRENILDPRARFIGLGTVTDATGTSWNTMDFTDSYTDSYGVARTRPAA